MTVKAITLEEAIRKNVIRTGDWVNPYNLYSEDKNQIGIESDKSGIAGVQIFRREDNLKCFYAKDMFGIDTLWFDTTKTKLYLNGECGYINGIFNVESICSTFSDLKMGLVARATNEKDIEYLCVKKTAKNLLEYNDNAWLGSSFIYVDSRINYGLDYVDAESSLIGKFHLVDSEGTEFYSSFGVRPAVSIWSPKRILVDVMSMERDGAWKLFKISVN